MYKPFIRIFLKILELCGCIACVVVKRFTDEEAKRIILFNRKYSTEWTLLSNVTWSREGNAFANVTYGGFTLITALLLITKCINPRLNLNLIERVFLITGLLFFLIMGSIAFASIDQIPPDLFDNAIILGSLSYFVALLFLIDLGDSGGRSISTDTQTDNVLGSKISETMVNGNEPSLKKNTVQNNSTIAHSLSADNAAATNGNYFSGENVDTDIIQTDTMPRLQYPVFETILMPEKLRPTRQYIPRPTRIRIDRDHLFDEYHSDNSTSSLPKRKGFVAKATRMWERKAQVRNMPGPTTLV